MNFCAVICEYNPFHNGHKHQLGEMKAATGDKILCIMSGNFTQRGEAAVFDKYTRARHAVENGADVVIELPAAFAVCSAELFASGAVHILSSIPSVKTLAFGSESGTKESFLAAARALNSEDKEFKAALKEKMKDGTSYIRARNAVLLESGADVDEALLASPNNILGTEYCRALLAKKSDIEPLPLKRVGSGYADTDLEKNFSSAAALRAVLGEQGKKERKALKGNLPASVFADVERYRALPFGEIALCALELAAAEEIALTPDCSEGLENKLKSLARSNPEYADMLKKAVSKRYTLARLRRILVQNLLKIKLKDVRAFLAAPLYCNVLAVKKDGAEETLSALAGAFPTVVRKSDYSSLKKEALDCFNLDIRADALYSALSGEYINDFLTQFV